MKPVEKKKIKLYYREIGLFIIYIYTLYINILIYFIYIYIYFILYIKSGIYFIHINNNNSINFHALSILMSKVIHYQSSICAKVKSRHVLTLSDVEIFSIVGNHLILYV